jgi:hypothetical protein
LGSELLPAPESPLFEGLCLCLLLEFLRPNLKEKDKEEKAKTPEKTEKLLSN